MRSKTTLIVTILILVLSISAYADFQAYGEQEININTCAEHTEEIIITNPETTPQTISISTAGEGSEYISFSLVSFEIQAKSHGTIYAFYQAPCEEGEYPLDIYFTSADTEKILTQKITVESPDTINLTTDKKEQTIAACGTAEYILNLNNPQDITETYELNVKGHKDANLSENLITLLPGESTTITLTVSPQDCAQTGEYELEANAKTQETENEKTLRLSLSIENKGIPEVKTNVKTIRADFGQSSAEIPIKNTGSEETTYALSTDGPEWITIAPQTITLKPRETKQVKLVFNPDNSTAEGNYDFTLSMTSQETQAAYDTRFTIKLGPPTFYEKYPAVIAAIGVLILAAIVGLVFLMRHLNSPKIKEKRRKKKEKKEKRRQKEKEKREKKKQAKLDSQQRAKDKKKQAKLSKKEKKKAKEDEKKIKQAEKKQVEKEKKELEKKEREALKKEIAEAYKETYYLVKKRKTAPQQKKVYMIMLIGVILLILGLSLPYLIQYWQATIAGAVGLLAFYCVLLIRRAFVVEKKYKAIPKGTEKTLKIWKNGLTQAVITAKKDLSKFKTKISKITPHTKKGAHYQTIKIEDNQEASYNLSFKVPKSWCKKNRVKQENLRLAKLKEQEWKTAPSNLVGEDKKFLYYTAEIKPGTYTIRGDQERPKPHKPITAIIIGLVIVAAILIVSLAPSNTIQTTGIPAQYIKQNGQATINLDRYFNDPDGDKLTYSASSTEHIKVEILDNRAIISPQLGWLGQGAVKFTATDNKGGTAESNTVPTVVTRRLITPDMTPYIAIVIGLTALIMLLLGLRGLKKSYK